MFKADYYYNAIFRELDDVINPIANDIAQVADDPMDAELGEIYKAHLENFIKAYNRLKKEVLYEK